MMEKKNLKRAIAKFEELANDEDYEGNRKIINLDAFLKSDSKKKKKKKDQILESTPIKCNKPDQPNQDLNDTFEDSEDSSSSEIKTADQFLKQFITQPSLIQPKPKPKSSTMTPKPNKSTSNKSTKSLSILDKSNNSNKSSSKFSKSVQPTTKSSRKKSPVRQKPSSKSFTSLKSKQNKSKLIDEDQAKMYEKFIEFQNYQKLKESENHFLMTLQNQRPVDGEEDEELDEEDEELEDESMVEEDEEEDVENEELDEELDEEVAEEVDEEVDDEVDDDELDDESIDPENSELFFKEQQERVGELTNDELSDDNDIDLPPQQFMAKQSSPTKANYHQQSPSKRNKDKQICKVSRAAKFHQQSQSSTSDNLFDYVANFEYQRTATEELYELILKSEECSFNILNKLIRNIKQTLDQNELPEPTRVKPFFHFTPDNQIHATFIFINPKDIYYNPWESIISKNYYNLNLLFEKIYEVIFNFNYVMTKKRLQQ